MPRKKAPGPRTSGWKTQRTDEAPAPAPPAPVEEHEDDIIPAPLPGEEADPELAPPASAREAAPAKKSHKRKTVVAPIPQVEVWERRMVDPVQRGTRAPRLKQPGFEIRIINTEGPPGRYQEAVHTQGWIPIKINELADITEVSGLVDKADGIVRTGPNGVYVWCKMPTAVYNQISKRKVELSQSSRRSQQKHRERIMRAAEEHRPGGGDRVAALKGDIVEMRERIDMDPSDLEAPEEGPGASRVNLT